MGNVSNPLSPHSAGEEVEVGEVREEIDWLHALIAQLPTPNQKIKNKSITCQNKAF